MDEQLKRRLVAAQRAEISEYHVYSGLARRTTGHNSEVLQRIANEEKGHYEFWSRFTGETPRPRAFKVWYYSALASVLGFTFAIKLMERGEEAAEAAYGEIAEVLPEAERIMHEEDEHEQELLNILDEERLRYVGSVVLGLSDALVELTGALAGLTLALQDSRLIALIGLVTGIAAAMSMAASEYLSVKSEEDEQAEEGARSPLKASVYTGSAYIVTVFILIAPFLVLPNPLVSLAIALGSALIIVALFTSYISVAKDLPFRRRFAEMAGLVLVVSALSFGIGFLLRIAFGVEA